MKFKAAIWDMAKTLITSLIFVFIVIHMIGFVSISGQSMSPTLDDGEQVILNKVSYLVGAPERNDIIVFHPPTLDGYFYIKRVIGIPQDTVEIRDHKVYINGALIEENYINEPMETETMPEIKLLAGEYFVMGDNRNASSDSRYFGAIRKKAILGKLFRY